MESPARAMPDTRGTGLRVWLERNPLVAFFALTYTISWSVWLTQPALARLDPLSGRFFGLLAAYGPSLAAIALSALPGPRAAEPVPWRSRLTLPALVLAASVWVTRNGFGEITSSRAPALAAVLWALVALLPAWLFFMAGSSRTGVRELLRPLTVAPRAIWWALSLGLIGASYLAGYAILALLGQPWPAFPRTEPYPDVLLLVAPVFVSTLLYGGPLGEEAGWRGFALGRLQRRFSPLASSVILGAVWGAWHFPLHFQGVYDKLAVFTPNLAFALVMRLGSGVALSMLFTWMYNRTRGNLAAMVLLHTAANLSTGWLLPVNAGVYVGTVLLVVAVAALDRMWRRTPEASKPGSSEGGAVA